MKKILSISSKRAQQFINDYLHSTDYTLEDCYAKTSTAKTRAEYECRMKCMNENGRYFKIMSHNTFHFTCGWRVDNDLMIETATNSYQILNAFPF